MGEGFGNGGLWAGIGVAVTTLLAALVAWPKHRAQARNLNAEADGRIVARLYAEIERLDGEMKEVRAELGAVKADAATEKRELERENKQLRTKVGRLEKRIADLEEIFNITPPTPEQRRLLNKLEDGE